MNKNTRLYLVALLLFLGGAGYLVYSGFAAGRTYFLEVSQALAKAPEELRRVRLFGTVRAEGIIRSEGVSGVDFLLQDAADPAAVVSVVYKGTVPDAFKPGAEVIVEGDVLPGRRFEAHSLTTSCPSKYKKENRT